MKETRDQVENSRARYAHEASRQRMRADSLYMKLRALENAVRNATREIHPDTRHNAIQDLGRMVPKHQRKTLTELRRGHK